MSDTVLPFVQHCERKSKSYWNRYFILVFLGTFMDTCNMSTFLLTLNLSEDIYENYSYSTTHIQNVCFTHFITIYFLDTHIVSTHTAAKWVILISWLLYFLLTLILSEEMYEKCSYKYHPHSKCVFTHFISIYHSFHNKVSE